jgi:MFS family permease
VTSLVCHTRLPPISRSLVYSLPTSSLLIVSAGNHSRSGSWADHGTLASAPLTEGGCAFGALAGYPIGHYLGRKWGLFFTALVFTVGAVLQCVASGKTGLGIMYAGRFIAGIGVGTASNLTVSCRIHPDEVLWQTRLHSPASP